MHPLPDGRVVDTLAEFRLALNAATRRQAEPSTPPPRPYRATGSGLLAPCADAAWKDDGVPSYRLGVRWDVTPRATLGLEGSRVPAGAEDGSENAPTLRASMRW